MNGRIREKTKSLHHVHPVVEASGWGVITQREPDDVGFSGHAFSFFGAPAEPMTTFP
jgi:hypothetical protein